MEVKENFYVAQLTGAEGGGWRAHKEGGEAPQRQSEVC
jgi:hypothetical protein